MSEESGRRAHHHWESTQRRDIWTHPDSAFTRQTSRADYLSESNLSAVSVVSLSAVCPHPVIHFPTVMSSNDTVRAGAAASASTGATSRKLFPSGAEGIERARPTARTESVAPSWSGSGNGVGLQGWKWVRCVSCVRPTGGTA